MDFRELLARQLDEIIKKQDEIIITNSLANICEELDSFTEKIKDCLAKNQDLPQQYKERIQELNNEYNLNIQKFKELKGL